jgi:hypothetical protein
MLSFLENPIFSAIVVLVLLLVVCLINNKLARASASFKQGIAAGDAIRSGRLESILKEYNKMVNDLRDNPKELKKFYESVRPFIQSIPQEVGGPEYTKFMKNMRNF